MKEPTPVSAWVARFADLAPPVAPVLDLAAGGGRHARFFAARGHPVLAVDRDVSRLPGGLAWDLEDGRPWPFADRRFGVVVVVNYLHRPTLAAAISLVAPGGLLIYETFAEGQEAFGRPRNPDFLLRPGELLQAVRGRLVVLGYEHGLAEGPKMVQRIAAIDPGPAGLPDASSSSSTSR